MTLFLTDEGRLELSSDAMKIVAKKLKSDPALSALRAGLRHDFRKCSPLANIFLTGPWWGARWDIARALVRRALCGGFKTLRVTYNVISMWDGPISRMKIDWEPDLASEPLILSRKRFPIPSFLVDVRKTSREERRRLLKKFLSEKLSDPEPLHLAVLIAPPDAGPEWELQRGDLMSALFDELPRHERARDELVTIIEDPDYGVQGWKWEALKLWTAFNVSVSDEDHSDGFFRDGDLWISFQGGHLPGGPGIKVRRGSCPDPEGLYMPLFEDVFPAQIYRALSRISEGREAATSHTDRLNLVARACGYENWHAAEGRR